MKKILKKNNGITLIALVITIIILLILAGITLNFIERSGLLEKAEIANQKSRYANAKEIINLKLMEIQVDCIEKNEEYNIKKITKEMELAKNITVEKYYNKETPSIKEGISTVINNLIGIVVSVDEYSEYKFLIGESCKIEYVLEGEITDKTDIEDFTDIEEFENGIGKDNIEFSYEKRRVGYNELKLVITIRDRLNGIREIAYPDGEVLNCDGKNKIEIEYNIEYEEQYIFKITSNNGKVKEIPICEKKKILSAPSVPLANKWNLGVQNDTFITHQGTPVYNGEEQGVYLQNSVISTKENYILNSTFTIILETKNIIPSGWAFMFGMGAAGDGIGWNTMGVLSRTEGIFATSGAGDPYNIGVKSYNEIENDIWHIYTIKYDGEEFSLFVDYEKIGSSSAIGMKDSKLYVGGISNSGSSSSVYWGHASGYYRNLAIYNGALTDEEIEFYSFEE